MGVANAPCHPRVGRIKSNTFEPLQHTTRQQIIVVLQRCIGRTLSDVDPSWRWSTCRPCHRARDRAPRSFVLSGECPPSVAKLRFVQNACQQVIRTLQSAQQTRQKPVQPGIHVHRTALRGFQLLVHLFAFALNLRTQAVSVVQS